MNFPRPQFHSLVLLAAMLQTIPAMSSPPEASVPFISSPFHIDGKMEEPFWKEAATLRLIRLDTEKDAPQEETLVRLATSPMGLLIAFEAGDQEIVALDRPRDDNTYYDDCVEAFFTIATEAPTESFGFEINARGATADFLSRPVGWINRGWGCRGLEVATGRLDGGEKGFVVELFIPWAGFPRGWDLVMPPRKLRANFARWNRPGRHFSIWSDPKAPYPDPHRLDSYGWLALEPQPPSLP